MNLMEIPQACFQDMSVVTYFIGRLNLWELFEVQQVKCAS